MCKADMTTQRQVISKQALVSLVSFFVAVLCLWPWLFVHLNMVVGVDVAYLSESAKYLMQGKRMSEFYYDTNPPLSIILYVPNIILQNVTGLSLHAATTLYACCVLTCSLIASFYCLKKIGTINHYETMVLLSGALLASTVMTQYDFGQKDHFLSMALLPLILVQYAITHKIKLNVLVKSSVILVCGIFLLLKPQFGLVPAALFLHRAVKQKRIAVFLDSDFLILGASFFAYLAIIFLYFDDFLSVIVKDSLQYYTAYTNSDIISISLRMAVAPLGIVLAKRFIFKDATNVTELLAWASVICIIPFFMQGKGWTYHSFPYMALFFPSLMIIAYHAIGVCVDMFEVKKGRPVFQMTGIFLLFLLWGSISLEKIKDMPTGQDFQSSELVKSVNVCEGECSFFLFHDFINLSHETAVYTGQKHASRFPVLWFVPYLEYAQSLLDRGAPALLSQQEIDSVWKKYASMIEEDIKRHNPDTLLIAHVTYSMASDPDYQNKFDLVEVLAQRHSTFNTIWEQYEIADIIYIDRRKYVPHMAKDDKLLRFDVYRKIQEQ